MGWLDEPGAVADSLWLMLHDDATGRPRLRPRPAGLCMAAGLIAETLMARAITVQQDGTLAVLAERDDSVPAGIAVMSRVREESGRHSLETWLAFFSADASAHVAERLERAGYVERRRVGLRRRDQWVPADMNIAFAPYARLQARLNAAEPMDVPEVMLAALATAGGLGSRLFADSPPAARDHLQRLASDLDPSLQVLIGTTQSAVDRAIMAQRT